MTPVPSVTFLPTARCPIHIRGFMQMSGFHAAAGRGPERTPLFAGVEGWSEAEPICSPPSRHHTYTSPMSFDLDPATEQRLQQ
jgi:hypothetical protein